METIALGILVFLQRYIAGINEEPSYDSYGHLFFLRCVKEEKSGPFGSISLQRFGASGHFSHPFLLHWLLSIFDYKSLVKHQRLINPALDTLFVSFVFIYLSNSAIYEQFATTVCLLYTFTPSMFSRLSTGPRTAQFTPRLAAEAAGNIYFLLVLVPDVLPTIPAYTLACTVGCFVLLSSKFGVQSFIFLSVFISLIRTDITPFVVMTLSLAISCLITQGRFLNSLRSQYYHLKDYHIRNKTTGTECVSDRNSIDVLKNQLKERRYFAAFSQILIINSYTSTLIKTPAVLICVLLPLIIFVFDLQAEAADSRQMAPIIASIALFLTINRPSLLFLGEAERYINSVIVFYYIVIAIYANQAGLNWLIDALLLYGIIFTLAEAALYGGFSKRLKLLQSSQKEKTILANKDLISKLKKCSTSLRIIGYPYHAAGWHVTALTDHTIIYPISWNNKEKEEFTQFEDAYPYIKLEKLKALITKYNINVIVINKNSTDIAKVTSYLPEEWSYNEQLSNELYASYTERTLTL